MVSQITSDVERRLVSHRFSFTHFTSFFFSSSSCNCNMYHRLFITVMPTCRVLNCLVLMINAFYAGCIIMELCTLWSCGVHYKVTRTAIFVLKKFYIPPSHMFSTPFTPNLTPVRNRGFDCLCICICVSGSVCLTVPLVPIVHHLYVNRWSYGSLSALIDGVEDQTHT